MILIKSEENKKGMLYIVGTPIGNLGDITLRAIETLKHVDIILAEDTRQTLKLLNHLEIEKHLVSYHRHNEEEKIEKVVDFLEKGKNIALVSDAGMPIISDPGEKLVKYLIENNYKIETIPGVTALTTAIVKSGVDSTRFTFEGFLSINKKQRKQRLEELKNETRTMVFYEAPHKILATLKDFSEYLGNRKICIARELTKFYEEYLYLNIDEAIEKIKEKPIRGEIVLIIDGKDKKELENEKLEQFTSKTTISMIKEEVEKGLDKKEAIKKVAKLKKITKNEVYQEYIKFEGE
jgi:16S rRNA (cytidine1402-2'-O)-methyltransferase